MNYEEAYKYLFNKFSFILNQIEDIQRDAEEIIISGDNQDDMEN